MRCSKCGTESTANKKFCAECGNPLSGRCPKCAADNKPTSKFCEECGTALTGDAAAAAASPPQAASTAPNIRLAPEQSDPSTTIEGRAQDGDGAVRGHQGVHRADGGSRPRRGARDYRSGAAADDRRGHRYDGYVVQSTGDGIFALFGAPVAHEDHPQRALYAALRMQEELKRYSARLVADGGIPIQCRVGANTGEVVVRSISTGDGHTEYTPIGHTANLASRMQAVAPVGSIAASDATRKLVEGYFALKPLGPTKVKGVSEPVNVYEVTGLGPLRTRLDVSRARGFSRFVGRANDMETLDAALANAQDGNGQVVGIVAEAGTGKSRLCFEFLERCRARG